MMMIFKTVLGMLMMMVMASEGWKEDNRAVEARADFKLARDFLLEYLDLPKEAIEFVRSWWKGDTPCPKCNELAIEKLCAA